MAGVSSKVNKLLANLKKPEGILVKVRGTVVDMHESFKSFGIGLLMAVVLVYLILMAQLASFSDPVIILLAVPPGLSGVLNFPADDEYHAEHHVADGHHHDHRNRGVEQHFDRGFRANFAQARQIGEGSHRRSLANPAAPNFDDHAGDGASD